jgi:hypothetical protein
MAELLRKLLTSTAIFRPAFWAAKTFSAAKSIDLLHKSLKGEAFV